jgi:hypothetical protein
MSKERRLGIPDKRMVGKVKEIIRNNEGDQNPTAGIGRRTKGEKH